MTDYKQNPHPRQRYDITMTIADAPGPFASIKGIMQYDVVTPECMPPPDRFSGLSAPRLSVDIPVSYTRISDTRYVGTVHTDMMIDEDYYGEGVCHWRLISTRVLLKATGAPGETTFFPNLRAKDLLAGQAVTAYFWKGGYPRSEMENYPDFGEPLPSKFKPELQQQLFSITLAPKAVTP